MAYWVVTLCILVGGYQVSERHATYIFPTDKNTRGVMTQRTYGHGNL